MLKPLASLLLLTSITTTTATASATPATPATPATRATPTPFEGALEGQLARTERGNYVVSPASISLGLAMTKLGARGDTAAELERLLGVDADAIGKALMRAVATPPKDGPTLVIANRLYGDVGTTFLPAFLDATQNDYGARLQSVDFRHAAAAARDAINTWVAQTTHDKIKDLVSPATVTALTRLVLVDAIYMKASWATPFDGVTLPAPFALAGGATAKVDTMHGVMWTRTGTHDGARMVDIPCTGSLGMLVLVPDGSGSAALRAVEGAYAREGVAPFMQALATGAQTDLSMPRFTISTKLELVATLEKLGVTHAFGGAGDFSGMTAKEKLQLSSVIHQAWIKVDERGTEAAAATATVAKVGAALLPIEHQTFAVDRSFLFVVHDAQGNALFTGRVVDPTK